MSGTNPVATWLNTNYTTQDPSTYKSTIDGDFAVATRFVDSFAARQTQTPAMNVTVDPGHVFTGVGLTEIGNASVTGNTHSNQVIDGLSSTVGLVVGLQINVIAGAVSTLFPAGTTITSIDSATQIHVSNNATSTLTGITFGFTQVTGTITAPVSNPRIDRVVVDNVSGIISVITGTAAATPSAPAITAGKSPIAQVLLQTTSTSITNSMITDERDFYWLGRPASAQVSIASNTTTDLGSTKSNNVLITGTTTITAFGSSASTDNPLYQVTFGGILTLTYNATSMKLPGAANITTAANDSAVFLYLGSGNWQCLSYSPASGKALVSPTQNYTLLATQSASTSATIDFTSNIDSTYSSYVVEFFDVVPATNTVSLYARVSEDGSTWKSGATDYNYLAVDTPSNTGTFSGATSGPAGQMVLTGTTVDNSTSIPLSGFLKFYNPSGSSKDKMFVGQSAYNGNGSNIVWNSFSGVYKGAANAIVGIRFLMSSGNITSGTFKLYGVS